MTLVDIILTIFITSLFCCGLSVVTSEGMILFPVRNFILIHVQPKYHYYFKPLILCAACMSSVWGIVTFSILHGFNHIPQMILCCVCSCFVNAFFISKYNQ